MKLLIWINHNVNIERYTSRNDDLETTFVYTGRIGNNFRSGQESFTTLSRRIKSVFIKDLRRFNKRESIEWTTWSPYGYHRIILIIFYWLATSIPDVRVWMTNYSAKCGVTDGNRCFGNAIVILYNNLPFVTRKYKLLVEHLFSFSFLSTLSPQCTVYLSDVVYTHTHTHTQKWWLMIFGNKMFQYKQRFWTTTTRQSHRDNNLPPPPRT